MAEPQQHNLIGSIIAGKVIEKVTEKALEKFASRRDNTMAKKDVPQAVEVVSEAVEKEVQSRSDHVLDKEPFYKSRNVWGSFVGLVTAADLIFQMWNDGLANTPTDYLTPVGIIVTALTPIYSRYIAKKPIGE